MGMLRTGLNKVRDFWDVLNDAIEAGTGTTQETAQDTDLQTPVGGTEFTANTSSTNHQAVLKEAQIAGAKADGSSQLSEFIWKTASPEKAGSRIVTKPVTWSTSYDTIVDTEYVFYGRSV